MNKNELLAGTAADKRTAAESIPSASLEQNGVLSAVETDLDIVKNLLQRYKHLDTISWLYLDEFQDRAQWNLRKGKKEPAFETLRTRFRNALNEAVCQKLCVKRSAGASYYQTNDTLGGKSYNCYTEIEFWRSSQ